MYLRNKIALLVAVTAFSTMANANNGSGEVKYGKYSTGASRYYYELGGSEIAPPTYSAGQRVGLRLQANASLGYSCGEFSAFENIKDIMNDFKNQVDNLGNTVNYAIGQAVAAAPTYLMYEADPVLAQILTNAKFTAEEAFKMSIKSCEQMQSSILAGEGPGQWVSFNMKKGLQTAITDGDVATEAVKKAQNKGSCPEGVKWVGGRDAGGYRNTPLNIEEDVIKAGYNIMRDEANVTTNRVASSAEQNLHPLLKRWKKPSEAKDWLVSVIGQTSITLCKSNNSASTTVKTAPGKGLMPYYSVYMEEYQSIIYDLVYNPTAVTTADYKTIGETEIPSMVINSIKALHPTEQEASIKRLASEYAIRKASTYAINAKQLLRTGARDVDIELATPAKPYINNAIAKLDEELQELIKNAEIQQKFVYPAMRKISESQSGSSYTPPSNMSTPSKANYKNGAIQN